MKKMLTATLLLLSLLSAPLAPAARAATPVMVETATLNAEVTNFLAAEVAAHLSDIKSLDPPPERVLGAGATGEYTWGTFMRAVAAVAELSGRRELAGRDLAREVGRLGLLEHRLKGTRFSQMYAALALRHFGRDLATNPVWQSLDEGERARWRQLLDVSAFYDARTRQVIKLPENYLGVAARIAGVSFQLGLLRDRALLDGVVTRAAEPFTKGALYADDAPPTGRFDRYSNEYARFVWDAAEAAGRQDILDALRPTLRAQMRLWWGLVLPDGYGYAWGRSLGAIGYMDTMEIVAFLGRHAEFRPAPLPELASAYYQAWRWLRRDFNDRTHMLSVFAPGRGNYAYITREREWQQTAGFFGKAALSHAAFVESLAREGVRHFPAEISRPDLVRFEFFRRGPRQAGVWLVRRGPLHFTLPLTTGTKPGVADYLPAPHGLPGFAAPVEQVYPSFTSFVELEDGRVLTTGDGADEIEVGDDGRRVRATWRRWSIVGGKSAALAGPGITSEVNWFVNGTTLVREEAFTASAPVTLRRWRFALPTTAARHRVRFEEGSRRDLLESGEGALEVRASVDWPFDVSLSATEGGPLGRGARGPVPLHLVYEARDVRLPAGRTLTWLIAVRAEGKEK